MKIHREDSYWVALFSGTGREIENICKHYNTYPDVIVCNSKLPISSELLEIAIENKISLWVCPSSDKVSVDQYLRWFTSTNGKKQFITLHGWMKIIPDTICQQFEIYNLHPGDIETYPELKGKDPQEKAFKLKHNHCGCVIHRVTGEVDSGEIVTALRDFNFYKCVSKDQAIECLHNLAFKTWLQFLSKIQFAYIPQKLSLIDKFNLKFFKLFRKC